MSIGQVSSWYSEGQAIEAIAVDDRAAQFGDGLFETIAIRDAQARFWPLHIARLQTGCMRLGIQCPPVAVLQAELQSAISQAPESLEFATAKLVVSAGCSPRGYQRDPMAPVIVRVGIFAATQLPANAYRDGVEVRMCSSRLAVQPQLAGLKSMNRLEQVLARSEWTDAGIFEGLMQDTAGRLICGTMSNMFMATKSGLHTPALTRCGVSGIMRQHLLGLMRDQGIDCDVRDIDGDELAGVKEVFLSNSQFGVIPVRRCANLDWKVGPITRKIQTLAAANGVPECTP